MKTAIFTFLFSALVVLPAFGQINQTSPELCGKPNAAVRLPPTMRATIDRSIGQGDLYLEIAGVVKKISLPGVVNMVDEVCPVSIGRVVVFSNSGYSAEMDIIDIVNGLLLDSIHGFAPLMSPNQRWLVYRKFYPRRTELPVSEEYLLYNLTKSPAQNRPPGIALNDCEDVGTAIFPLGQKNLLVDNIDMFPPEQQHGSASGFFWAPDSRAVAFGDSVQEKVSIVLVTLDDRGGTTALVYPVPISALCSPPVVADYLITIQRIEVGNREVEDRPIHVDFWSTVCSPKPLDIRSSDFLPPKTEIHARPKRKGSVVDPQ